MNMMLQVCFTMDTRRYIYRVQYPWFHHVICCLQRTWDCVHTVCCYKVRVMDKSDYTVVLSMQGWLNGQDCRPSGQIYTRVRVGRWKGVSKVTLYTQPQHYLQVYVFTAVFLLLLVTVHGTRRLVSAMPGHLYSRSHTKFSWNAGSQFPVHGHQFPAGSGRGCNM